MAKEKIEIDKLSIISSKIASVTRDGKNKIINIKDVVLDDIINYKRGSQIIADSIIKEGIVEVNESLISGEENSITKKEGDILYSGSFIVSGWMTGALQWRYYPTNCGALAISFQLVYLALCLTPVIINGWEANTWKHLNYET